MLEYGAETKLMLADSKAMNELLRYHDSFRRLVAIIADHSCSVDILTEKYTPRFIYKCEGGVSINGRALVLGKRKIYPDYGSAPKPTKEEVALVDSLEAVAKRIRQDGLPLGLQAETESFLVRGEFDTNGKDIILNKIAGETNPFGGDHWRDFFDEAYRAKVREANEKALAAGEKDRYF